MVIDLTLKITPKMVTDAQGNEKKALTGHLGTHFDVMNKEFPLEYTECRGVVFDVSHIQAREIQIADIEMTEVESGMFVAFYSGYLENCGYGNRQYFTEHPQLSVELLEKLCEKQVSIIGIDFAGVRRGKEHTPMDQYCADRGVFIIENLCNLAEVLKQGGIFKACTYPMNFADMTGLPCRVMARNIGKTE